MIILICHIIDAESTKAVKAEPGPSTSSMPPPPYNYYGGCVIKSEAAASVSDDAEMEAEGETAAAPGGGNFGVGRMDPVLSLVMEQARKDIDFTCSALSISNGERQSEFDKPLFFLVFVKYLGGMLIGCLP